MPKISEFYGIAIYLFHRDHQPPHFHAIYGEFEASVEIGTLRILDGKLPNRAQRLVLEWGRLQQAELAENWQRANQRVPLARIAPLD